MVAVLATQSLACEDQSAAWTNQQASYAPMLAANSAVGNSANSSTAANASHRGRRSNLHAAQNDAQNSVSTDTKKSVNRCWSHHVDARAAVSPTRLMSKGMGTTQSQSSNGGSSSSSSSTPEQTTKRAAREAMTPMQREKAFNCRIIDWDLGNTGPTTTTPNKDACDREVQRDVVADVPEGFEGTSNGGSSPALSTSNESKRSSAESPTSPPLSEAVRVEAPNTTNTTKTDSVPSVLPHVLTDAVAPSSVAAPSYITPRVSFTEPPLSPPSPGPSKPLATPAFSMADVKAALRSSPENQHPFLDMNYQRSVRKHERVQELLNQQLVRSFQNQLSGSEQACAFKCLLNAAHRRQYAQCMARDHVEKKPTAEEEAAAIAAGGARAPSDAGRWGPCKRRLINRQWRMVAEQSECDLYREGLGVVQRKLSCMCLFNPDIDLRVYDENSVMREQRCHRQQKLLICLHRQRVRGGNPYFLHEAQ